MRKITISFVVAVAAWVGIIQPVLADAAQGVATVTRTLEAAE